VESITLIQQQIVNNTIFNHSTNIIPVMDIVHFQPVTISCLKHVLKTMKSKNSIDIEFNGKVISCAFQNSVFAIEFC
jgi:hypothetical protein